MVSKIEEVSAVVGTAEPVSRVESNDNDTDEEEGSE